MVLKMKDLENQREKRIKEHKELLEHKNALQEQLDTIVKRLWHVEGHLQMCNELINIMINNEKEIEESAKATQAK